MTQFLRDQASDSEEVVTPLMLDGTYLSRNFATLGPLTWQPPCGSRTDPCGILFPGIGPYLSDGFSELNFHEDWRENPSGKFGSSWSLSLSSFSWNRMPVLFSFLYSFAIPGVNLFFKDRFPLSFPLFGILLSWRDPILSLQETKRCLIVTAGSTLLG